MLGLGLAGVPVTTGYKPHLTSEVDLSRIKKIKERCKKKGWMTSRCSKKGAHALGVLRRKLGADEGKIDKVLDFLETKDVVKPRICDGSHLSNPKVWNWLLDMMEKESRRSVSQVSTVGEVATAIAKRLSRLVWKKGSGKQLAAAAQLSIDRMHEFRERCKSFKSKSSTARQVAERLAGHLTNSVIDHLAGVWVESLHGWVHQWKDWDGDLMKLAWDFRREQCRRYARDHVNGYFGIYDDPGRPEAFDLFLKEYLHD